jgi:hypothetical protein
MVDVAGVRVSRFILGSNPFSGFSHQGKGRDLEMMRHYTTQRIKETLRRAESLGINTLIGRTDHHVMRVLLEHRDEGGTLQWFAQTCPGVGPTEMCINRAKQMNARACHLHGGVMDNLVATGRTAKVQPAVDTIREKGMLAGIAGHNIRVFEWAEEHLDCDYYMCCYYNPSPRDKQAAHDPTAPEIFREEDRAAMTAIIPSLSRPVIHYKVLAAGRNEPVDAFDYVARILRPNDTVCVGIYTADVPDMLERDVALFEASLAAKGMRQRV